MSDSTPSSASHVELDTPVAMIAALSQNRVIGVDNQLPWYLPEDLKHFKALTLGKPLVMGRKTFESIGRPLPGRLNIVITRSPSYRHEGVRVCHDLAAALALADQQALIDGADEIMVMGGGEIYAQALPLASHLYLTEVAVTLNGDAHFPTLEDGQWQEIERVAGAAKPGQPDYAFVHYRRAGSSG
ncbi:dihydrofolate reductase [Salinicola endophyticus]|uniref:Dihydrofolate reductase n=3 Tax=Salinicola TaxID=404432 RepID=A0ABY8FBQ0_9GAMM|nr:dihydrofolate reductase [Salinicola endophyticus]WFF40217.1 dihydrofolate reductase [Salinicola endophyticus]